MSVNEWIAIVGLMIAASGGLYATIKFMVKAIMSELKPNAGNSLKDQVSRIEQRLDQLMLELLNNAK